MAEPARGIAELELRMRVLKELGGFHRLSGYRDGQLLGNYLALARLAWYQRLPIAPAVAKSP